MRNFAATVMVAGGLLMAAGEASARRSVGNGGDELRLAFAKAKEHAAHVTLKASDRALALTSAPLAVRKWLLENRDALAGDIAATPHDWDTDPPDDRCAWTLLQPAARLDLSFQHCRQAANGVDGIGELLVHESVHHLGIADEAFADAVALAVYSAWRRGATEWQPLEARNAPSARYLHSATWTGNTMIVFGGATDVSLTRGVTNTGAEYDPRSNTWQALPTSGAPARFNHAAIWTGKKLIVWGGYVVKTNGSLEPVREWQNSGAVYEPGRGWSALATPYGPSAFNSADWGYRSNDERQAQIAVWTGKEMIVYGGRPVNGVVPGGIYNPEKQGAAAWRPLSADGAPAGIFGHAGVWADGRLMVSGGIDQYGNQTLSSGVWSADQGWLPLPTRDAPGERDGATAVWTGQEMIVFGGFDKRGEMLGNGAAYDIEEKRWKPILTDATQGRYGHSALWSGNEMLVFGGKARRLMTHFNSVAAFSPAAHAWRVVEGKLAPSRRTYHTAVWTGSSMIVFGGQLDATQNQGTVTNSGGIFFP